MKRFQEFNILLYGEMVGWMNGRKLLKPLTPNEYEILLSLLSHKKSRLRWSAAVRLGNIGEERATDALIHTLHDENWLVRLHAAKALGKLKSQKAIEPLTALLNDNCDYVRRRVVRSIGQVCTKKDDRIIEALISVLKDPDNLVRAYAAWVLGNYVSPASISAIASAVGDPNTNVSWRAVDALEKIGTAAVPALINLLKSHNEEVRYRAVKTLGKIRDPRAVPSIEGLLNDPDEKVRQRAKFAVRQIKYPFFKYTSSHTIKPLKEKMIDLWRKLWK